MKLAGELKQLCTGVFLWTLGLSAFASLAAILFFPGTQAGLGVWCGAAVAMAGFMMIVSQYKDFGTENPKGKGVAGYLLRYAFYALTLGILAYAGIPVLALLTGIVCQKGAVLFYSLKTNGKEGRHG